MKARRRADRAYDVVFRAAGTARGERPEAIAMHWIYKHGVNVSVRTLLRPFARLIPTPLQFPVTGQIKVALGEGKEIRFAANPTFCLTKILFWNGIRAVAYPVYWIFVDLVKTSRIMVDVGANVGYYTLIAAAFNPDLEIISFEPLPDALHYLHRNIRLNGFTNIRVEELALSDRNGTADFFTSRNPKFPEVQHHLASTASMNEQLAARSDLVEKLTVRTETLDDYIAREAVGRVDLLKLDTEASEHLVLAGAEKVLADHRPMIFCEVLPGEIEDELTSILRRFDYRFFRGDDSGLVPVVSLSHERAIENEHVMAPAERAGELDRFLARA